MTPLAPRTLSALRTTRSCFGVDRLAPGQSSLFGSFHGSTASGSDLGSYLFFFGLIATTFLI